jgi:hypothetical protein
MDWVMKILEFKRTLDDALDYLAAALHTAPYTPTGVAQSRIPQPADLPARRPNSAATEIVTGSHSPNAGCLKIRTEGYHGIVSPENP